MSGSTSTNYSSSALPVSGAVSNAQNMITSSPLLMDAVFIFAIFGLLYAWKLMIEGLIE
jgi:hypothetical protein